MSDPKILNNEQQQAVIYGDGPLLLIAGAGTGKTTVITKRIQHLILEKGILPRNILALTFTEKAAKEMEERIDVALPYGYTQMWISTFHGFCDRVLRSSSIHIGLDPSYKMLTEAESLLFLREHIFQLHLSYFRPLGNPTKFLQGLLQHFSRLKDEDVTPEEYLHYAQQLAKGDDTEATKLELEKVTELAHAYKTYEDLKIKEGVMDFGDLISNTLKLFRTRKNVLSEYQKQFQYILIDEFQDTNFAQNQLALLLAGKKQNITVVGDDDQAIYRWRGAAISNMIQFREHFPKTTIITLTKNYRSTSNILDSAYQLVQYNNPDRLEVKEHINKKLTSERNIVGNPPEYIFTDTADNEAEKVTQKIQELIKEKKYQYKDFAILVRANDHSQLFIRTLERQKIPYQFLGPGQLFHQEEIKDLIAYLKVLYNFDDSSSLYRVLTMQIFHIPARDIASLLNYSKKTNESLFKTLEKKDDIDLSDTGKEKVEKIHDMLKNHLELLPRETAGQILYHFLEESGILPTLLKIDTQEDEIKAQNIAKLFERIKNFESQHDNASVFAVVDWIELSMQMGESPLAASIDWTENNAVNILTIHASKGLEFPVVFIVNLVTQRFPTRERHEQIPLPDNLIKEVLPVGDFHLQEERRLFYVAMTRAKDMLFLTSAQFYGDNQSSPSQTKRERKISPFVIDALGQEKVEKIQLALSSSKKQLNLLEVFQKSTSSTPNAQRPTPTTPVTYLSYSRIRDFEICPLHYKLKYLLEIPTPQSSAQSYGTSIHSTLAQFYLRQVQGEKLTTKDIKQILSSCWIKEGYSSKTHEEIAFNQALTTLKNHITNNFDSKNLPIGLEIPFQFKVGKLTVGGRIDRIDRIDEKTLEIIDYKTGNNIPSEKELKDNFQLTLYGLAASEIRDPLYHRKPYELLLSLYYIEQGKKITTVRSREEVERAKETLLQKADEISKSTFTCSHTIFCQNCEYKMLCKTST